MSHQQHLEPLPEGQVRRIARYGWKPDLPDARDHLFSVPRIAITRLPPSVDLSKSCPPVYDQGQIGSCTANAIAAAFEFELAKQRLADLMPSRLFIYYNERKMEGTVASDSGAQIRDGFTSISKQGVVPESEWPYDDTPAESDGSWPPHAKAKQAPPKKVYTDALKNRATTYSRVIQDLDQMKGCLAAGYPFVAGFTVYSSFESQQVARSGIVPMPQPSEAVVGGHAIMVVGYDDSKSCFFVRNSWGTTWGLSGYFWMPYAYLTESSLSGDFWTLRIVT